MEPLEPWLTWAMEIQSIAQNGLAYCKDVYDQERYQQLRKISSQMLAHKTGISEEKVTQLFCNETGYQTPKMDCRAAIFEDGKILLVHEKNGTWALPGGWIDVLESVAFNTKKEVKEEAGLDVKIKRVIALQDYKQHNQPMRPYGICKVFLLCEKTGGQFVPNIETTETKYFSLDALPKLAEEKCNLAQIEMCFQANADENWKTQVD